MKKKKYKNHPKFKCLINTGFHKLPLKILSIICLKKILKFQLLAWAMWASHYLLNLENILNVVGYDLDQRKNKKSKRR
jgi:hypothetical protein